MNEMKHIIKLSQSLTGWYDVKYRRKQFRFHNIQQATDKLNELMIGLFFSGIPLDDIHIIK
jgi:hypothetical protein